jgi:UDP-N-acetylmuramate--alanine ligase
MKKSVKKIIPTKSIPLNIGCIHHIGIGGIGMSGVAEILHNLGYEVSGSDLTDNYNVARLRNLGIKVFIGHEATNVENASVIVRSTAVQNTNPEIIAAREKKIPVVSRSEMLAELTKLKSTIAISGSHGKTTTTSMIGHLLEASGLHPTVINGGVINAYGSNAKLGSGDWLVAEADESDGTFVKIPSTVGVITNIDPEHLDYWGSFTKLLEAFEVFLKQLPFYGFGVLNHDHERVREIAKNISDRKIYFYSMDKNKIANNQAAIVADNIKQFAGGSNFDVIINSDLSESGEIETHKNFTIPLNGIHNVSNSLAAIAVGFGIGLSAEQIKNALQSFEGVKRRFTKVGEFNGYKIIDDYAHHPVEIAATLAAAKQALEGTNGKVIAVCQPHRYTRLNNLFMEFSECFASADKVIITEMYSAGEKPIEGVDQFALEAALKKHGKDVVALDSDKKLAETVVKTANSGDLVICMGAGTITKYAAYLAEELAKL